MHVPKSDMEVLQFLAAADVMIACEQARIWEHTREKQRANSKARRSGGEESGEEALRK